MSRPQDHRARIDLTEAEAEAATWGADRGPLAGLPIEEIRRGRYRFAGEEDADKTPWTRCIGHYRAIYMRRGNKWVKIGELCDYCGEARRWEREALAELAEASYSRW